MCAGSVVSTSLTQSSCMGSGVLLFLILSFWDSSSHSSDQSYLCFLSWFLQQESSSRLSLRILAALLLNCGLFSGQKAGEKNQQKSRKFTLCSLLLQKFKLSCTMCLLVLLSRMISGCFLYFVYSCCLWEGWSGERSHRNIRRHFLLAFSHQMLFLGALSKLVYRQLPQSF